MTKETRSVSEQLEDALRRFGPIAGAVVGAAASFAILRFLGLDGKPARTTALFGYGLIGGAALGAFILYGMIVGCFSLMNLTRDRRAAEWICVGLTAVLLICAGATCLPVPAMLIRQAEEQMVELKKPKIVEVITDRGRLEEKAQFFRNRGQRQDIPSKATVYAPVDTESIRSVKDRIRRVEEVKPPIRNGGFTLIGFGAVMLSWVGVRVWIRKRRTTKSNAKLS